MTNTQNTTPPKATARAKQNTRTPTQGKARFGKKRVNGCECDYSYTCGKCLADRPVYYFNGQPI